LVTPAQGFYRRADKELLESNYEHHAAGTPLQRMAPHFQPRRFPTDHRALKDYIGSHCLWDGLFGPADLTSRSSPKGQTRPWGRCWLNVRDYPP
jgi:hypothetical protein